MLHRDVLPNTSDNHSILEWRVADAAARSALSLSLTDIGKACLQIDTGDVYLLLNNVGPVWKLMTTGIVPKMFFGVACSDETTALVAGTNKIIFHSPTNMINVEMWIGLSTVQSTGASLITVDVNKNGTTMLSTKLTIDNGEETSRTAATPAVQTSTTLAIGDKMAVDLDLVGDGTAKGLKLYFRGDAT